ncbi:MAG: hypothetical protein JWQ38_187 [Flavipsychrobacter sp.]|nr:hypothetical protein [Flavipsychrobacter sp.]
MAEISFSLANLFEQTFGYKTKAFDPEFTHVTNVNPPSRNEQGTHGSSYYAKDKTGTEYFMPVTLTYTDISLLPASAQNKPASGGNQTSATLRKWNLPYPVISISSRKTIIETPLTERRGTVKELINIKDYEITIKGFIIGNKDEFPEADITILRTIFEQNIPLSIQCPLTDIFLLRPSRSGSDHIVITELKLPTISGVKNIRPYELHLVSDEPFNLISIS